MSDSSARDRIIVALDFGYDDALAVARTLQGTVRWVKVGMTLFYERGPEVVREIRGMGFDVFLDLKLHDIPHQVAGAAQAIGSLGAQMLTVHAGGGSAMVSAAVQGARTGAEQAGVPTPSVIAVTVLTSMNDAALDAVGVGHVAAEQVPLLARVARAGGADGVVCSPHEAEAMRDLLGEDALVVTPGVRPEWAALGDQARVATPAAALSAGASHLVIGRPVTGAADPRAAAQRVISEMEGE